MNIEAIGEVKVLTAGLPGRVRPVERPADHRRHQERHQPLPRLRLRPCTDSDWNANCWVNKKNGDAKPKSETKTLGLHDRRPGRQARRHQQAVLLLRPRVSPGDHGDQQRQPDPAARADRRPSATATSRRRVDNNGAPFNRIRDRSTAACTRRHAGCFQDGGVIGRFRNRLYGPASRSSSSTRCRTVTQTAGHRLQLRSRRRRPSTTSPSSRPSARLPAVVEAALHRQVHRRAAARDPRPGRSRVSATSAAVSVHHELRDHGELHRQPDDLPRSDLRVDPQRAGRRQRGRHPGERRRPTG